MARREWAEREVVKRLSGGWSGDAFAMGKNEAMDMLTKAHARAVRIVKAHMKAAQLDQHTWLKNERDGYLSACRDILAMLTKGGA